ncbi:MAG TPA: hypothetical protein VIT68_00500 [Candidatus Gracilibacteria bacterium]
MTDLPYLPEGRYINYVPDTDPFMIAAQRVAEETSTDLSHPTGAVLVQTALSGEEMGGHIIGEGSNNAPYHAEFGCERQKLGCATGEGYDKCPGCKPLFHAEQQAIKDAIMKGQNPQGADLYLWGHWWCCKSCWDIIIKAGVANVYLLEEADELFA